MFEVANDFFLSLGLPNMTMAYGDKAVIIRPKDREVVCHASAWDFSDGKDFRYKKIIYNL
jgi:peptidyl-dipeptidase A